MTHWAIRKEHDEHRNHGVTLLKFREMAAVWIRDFMYCSPGLAEAPLIVSAGSRIQLCQLRAAGLDEHVGAWRPMGAAHAGTIGIRRRRA